MNRLISVLSYVRGERGRLITGLGCLTVKRLRHNQGLLEGVRGSLETIVSLTWSGLRGNP